MLELSRTVRFSVNGDGVAGLDAPRDNGFAGWPAMRGLGRYYELIVRCVGDADPVTGYFINITHIDAAVRQFVFPLFGQMLRQNRDGAAVPMGALMRAAVDALRSPLNNTVSRVALQLTPFHSIEIESHDMSRVIVRQQFEFSAAHRLHVPSLSDEENRRVFGKCNNPAGHGHNYRIEVAVAAPIDATGQAVRVEKLDAVVEKSAVVKLDHKHLNVDVAEFRDKSLGGGGLNPSVENIAKVVHGWLAPALADAGMTLDEVSVWETSKTVCTYRG